MFSNFKNVKIFSFFICFIIFINIFLIDVKAKTLDVAESDDNYIVFFTDNYVEKGKDFIGNLEKAGINYEILDEFSGFIQGYMLKLNKEDAQKIKAWEGVESISQEKTYMDFEIKKKSSRRKRDLESNKIIGQDKLNPKYDGRDMVVAVIDSGGDVSHPDFRLDEGIKGRLTKEKVEGLIKSGRLKGQYVNEKIPFIRDYAGLDNDIKELKKESHGMHVAGIIGANPLNQSNVARGVIPNSQLVLMKVFGNNGGASSRAYIKAIEDAVLLGVDSINMSLGLGGGSILLEDPAVSKAINLAREKGINVSIAGGNDGYYGWGKSLPDVRYPDYGVTSMPGINTSGLTVASIENTKQQVEQFDVENSDRNIGHNVINNIERLKDKESYYNDFKEVVFKEFGEEQDFSGSEDFSGKIVIIKRGKNTFKEKIANASKYGAKFVVIENYEAEGENFVNMEVAENDVASTMITCLDGQYLRSLNSPKIKISKYAFSIDNPNSGRLSEFSSWGITADGDLKPDITAPGGKIYSTINESSYNSQSGTSMASPHVAGAIAVMNKVVAEKFPTMNGSEKHQLVKNLLMNSALPHTAINGQYSSPRQQGAGILNLKRAMDISAVIYGETGLGSINLGNISTDKVSLKFTIENLTDKSIFYKGKIKLTTDTVVDNKFTLLPQALGEEDLGTIELKAMEKMNIEKEIDISKLKFPEVPNGKYLDGFIVLFSDSEMELSMPFTGFIGDWTNLNVIEDSIYDLLKENKLPLYAQDAKSESSGKDHNFGGPAYEFTHISTLRDNRHFVLGAKPGHNPELYYDKNHIAISPNGDGINDHIRFNATFLRSYKDMIVRVTDESGQKNLYTSLPKNGIKNFFGNDKNNDKVTANDAWKWDGKEYSSYKDVPDGKYKFIVTVKPVVNNANEQQMEFPIIVDRVRPEVEKAYYNDSKRVFKLEKIKEELSGVRFVESFYMEGEKRVDLKVENKDGYSIIIPDGKQLSDIRLHIEDWAGNIYKHSLEESIRDENARLIIRTSLEGDGQIPDYKVKILDENSALVETNELKMGKSYRVIIEVLNPAYEVVGKNEEKIIFADGNNNVILNKVFRKIEYFDVSALIYKEYKDSSDVSYKYDGEAKIKIVNVETKEELILEKDKETTVLENMYSIKAKIGKYKPVAFGVKPGWKVKFSQDIINVQKRAGYADAFSFRAYYEKEKDAEKDKKKVYLQEAVANQYKNFAINPINFEFTNLKTGEKTNHMYRGLENSLVELEYGKYKVNIKEMPDWRLSISLVKDNEIEIGASLFGYTTVIFKLTKIEPEEPNPKPEEPEKPLVKKGKVWLQSGSLNEYKGYSKENPIEFSFKNLETGKITMHKFGNISDYELTLEYGTYEISAQIEGYEFRLDVVKNNTIKIGEDTLDHESVIFIFKKLAGDEPLEPKPEEPINPEKPVNPKDPLNPKEPKNPQKPNFNNKIEVRLQAGYYNEYTDFSDEKPIEFSFKNTATGQTIKHKYAGFSDHKVMLEAGVYEVLAQVEGYEFRIEVAENNMIKLDENSLDYESVIFVFKKIEEPGSDQEELKPQAESIKLFLSFDVKNEYKEFLDKKPLIAFTPQSGREDIMLPYSGQELEFELPEGSYSVSFKNLDGWKLKIYEIRNESMEGSLTANRGNIIDVDSNLKGLKMVLLKVEELKSDEPNLEPKPRPEPKPNPNLEPKPDDNVVPNKPNKEPKINELNSDLNKGIKPEDSIINNKLKKDKKVSVDKLEKSRVRESMADRNLEKTPHTGEEFNVIYFELTSIILFAFLAYLKKLNKKSFN